MLILCIGLLLFLGAHAINIFAPQWRESKILALGLGKWSAGYSVVSLLGFVLIIIGYGQTRAHPVFVWNPPPAMAALAALLMLVAMVLLAATYIPGNRIKQKIGHPMTLSVKVWALSHLLANGRLGDIILFGSFLIWAVLYFVVARRRDRLSRQVDLTPGTSIVADAATVLGGIVLWAAFAFALHLHLIGVAPFGN